MKAVALCSFLLVSILSCAGKPEMNKPVRVVAPAIPEPQPDIPYEKVKKELKAIDEILSSITRKAPITDKGKGSGLDIFNRLYNDLSEGLW